MKNERTLEQLRAGFAGHIYLRFNSADDYADFLAKAETEGFRFGERLPTEYLADVQNMLALCENKQLSFCNTFSRMAYACGGDNVQRVDYAKYISGADDYLI